MKPPFDVVPPKLSLPQADDDRAGRERQLERARDAYRYSYDKPNIRGLARCEVLPEDEFPDGAWRAGLAGVAGRLVANAVAEAGLPGLAELEEILRGVKEGGLETAVKIVGEVVVSGERGRSIERLDDYATLFHEWRPPPEASEVFLDSTFARAARRAQPGLDPARRSSGPRVTERDYLGMLPSHESAHIQLFILKLLGSLYHSRLGHYGKGPAGVSYFGPGAIGDLEAAFVTELDGVERTIQERNQSRPAYRYLLPSEIPQSINI